MLENVTVPRVLTFGGLVITLVGWWITEWVYSREYDAFNSLLDPLGTILRYGGLIMLLAGIAWYAKLYYEMRGKKPQA